MEVRALILIAVVVLIAILVPVIGVAAILVNEELEMFKNLVVISPIIAIVLAIKVTIILAIVVVDIEFILIVLLIAK